MIILFFQGYDENEETPCYLKGDYWGKNYFVILERHENDKVELQEAIPIGDNANWVIVNK